MLLQKIFGKAVLGRIFQCSFNSRSLVSLIVQESAISDNSIFAFNLLSGVIVAHDKLLVKTLSLVLYHVIDLYIFWCCSDIIDRCCLKGEILSFLQSLEFIIGCPQFILLVG